jgi:alkaline phosphatase D
MGHKTTRRAFLAGAAGAAAAASVPRWASAAAPTNPAFPWGVASGDPLHDRVIIWTAASNSPAAVWEVARDAAFTSIVRTGSVGFGTAADYTCHVDVDGLQPDTEYWYRFKAAEGTSDVGRTRTLPAPGASVERLRFGVVTCTEWEFGYFGACRVLAERDDIDVVLMLGDYIYEFGQSYGPIPSPQPGGRKHDPPQELVSLHNYRDRYRQYHRDAGLQKLHARYPVIAIYDDHELVNDWWKDGAGFHDPATEGDFHARRDAALQAFREWLPVRVNAPDPTIAYRRFAFGNLVELFMLDERRYRDKQPSNAVVGYFTTDPETDDPNRTILGPTQRSWLLDGLTHSTAAWKVLGNPDSLLPIDVAPTLAGMVGDVLHQLDPTHVPPVPPPLLVDGWDGYNGDRQRVLDHIHDHTINDVVVLTGDYHESFASELPLDRASYQLADNSVAVEFVAPAITSPGLAETLQQGALPHAATINTVFEANLAASNPWVKYHEGFSNGFGVAEFRADGMQFDYWFVDNRTDPATGAAAAAWWKVNRGAPLLLEADGPLGPRPPRPAGAPQATGQIPRTGGDQSGALAVGAAAVAAVAAAQVVKKSGEMSD